MVGYRDDAPALLPAPGLWGLLVQGVLPFVPGDVAKLVLVASVGTAVVPGGSLASEGEQSVAE